MTITAPVLEVRKIKRSFCICAGVSVLGRFKTEDQALAELNSRRSFYEYWAGSMGVSVENSDRSKWVTIYA